MKPLLASLHLPCVWSESSVYSVYQAGVYIFFPVTQGEVGCGNRIKMLERRLWCWCSRHKRTLRLINIPGKSFFFKFFSWCQGSKHLGARSFPEFWQSGAQCVLRGLTHHFHPFLPPTHPRNLSSRRGTRPTWLCLCIQLQVCFTFVVAEVVSGVLKGWGKGSVCQTNKLILCGTLSLSHDPH